MAKRALFWLVAALAAAGIAASLGLWQLDRAAQKLALQAARETRRAEPPLRAPELPRSPEAAGAALHRQVSLQGHWLGSHTVYLENRVMGGRTGFVALTPLALADGSTVLVQRGWMPRDLRDPRRITQPLSPQIEPAAVRGRLALEAVPLFDLGQAASGPIRQNVQVLAYARETGLKLLPWVLVQEEEPVPADGLLRRWSEPAVDVHKNYGYAFQWFALGAVILILYVWLRVIRPRRR